MESKDPFASEKRWWEKVDKFNLYNKMTGVGFILLWAAFTYLFSRCECSCKN